MSSKVQLTNDDVLHVAKLIRIFIDTKDIESYKSQLNTVLESLEVLEEVDTEKTKITSQVTNLVNIFREDEIQDSLTQDEALSNTKSKRNGYFIVKKVISKK